METQCNEASYSLSIVSYQNELQNPLIKNLN